MQNYCTRVQKLSCERVMWAFEYKNNVNVLNVPKYIKFGPEPAELSFSLNHFQKSLSISQS